MPEKIDLKEHLDLLLSCIRHSNNGKIDFDGVAKDLKIVSRGAAAKRYERLLKANNVRPPGAPESSIAAGGTSIATITTASNPGTPSKSPRKRVAKSSGAGGGPESPTKKNRTRKRAPKSAKSAKNSDSDSDDSGPTTQSGDDFQDKAQDKTQGKHQAKIQARIQTKTQANKDAKEAKNERKKSASPDSMKKENSSSLEEGETRND